MITFIKAAEKGKDRAISENRAERHVFGIYKVFNILRTVMY